ncbi:MAG: hypothetical protein JWQ98_3493 [Chlorobi bacterium]|nr:hypothetical protein [Chlorobiota bacterium]
MNEYSGRSATELTRLRWLYIIITLAVIPLGLGSRRYGGHLPAFVATYAGDTLWTVMFYFIVVSLAPRLAIRRAALTALAASCVIEILQLYHAPWIDSIRATTLGGLALGFTFLWSDMVCYTVGVLIAVVLDIMARRIAAPPRISE